MPSIPISLFHTSSPTTAYLMAKLKLGADGALKVVKSKRPEAEPNPAFMAQLREFQLSSV